MAQERKVFIADIGEVKIKKRKGSVRISIRINQKGEVGVNIPSFVPYYEAEKFLESKRSWILKNRDKINGKKKETIIFSKDNLPKTRYHEIIISFDNIKSPVNKFTQGLCEIFLPVNSEINNPAIQNFIKYSITEVYRREAKIILVNRCKQLSEKYGFKINDIKIKKMKSRWGSCSSKKNINLNLFLMRIPEHLYDYVILHELVHTKHMNHSRFFWEELDKYTGNAKAMARELRKYGYVLSEFDT